MPPLLTCLVTHQLPCQAWALVPFRHLGATLLEQTLASAPRTTEHAIAWDPLPVSETGPSVADPQALQVRQPRVIEPKPFEAVACGGGSEPALEPKPHGSGIPSGYRATRRVFRERKPIFARRLGVCPLLLPRLQ